MSRKPFRMARPGSDTAKRIAALALTATLAAAATAHGGLLRIATYNIEADIDGYTTPRPGLTTVLEAIGAESVNGVARPLDVLALEETTSNATTVAPLITALNTYYASSSATVTYAQSSVQGTQAGSNGGGNGPNAIIYNTKTLTLLSSVGIATPTGSANNGMSRQVMRYAFQPIGGSSASLFYVYVSHAKSGTTAADLTARGKEASIIRTDITSLPAGSNVLVMGDLNLTAASEDLFTTLTAAGTAKLSDPLGASADGDWSDNASSFKSILTESSTSLDYRDDFQLDSAAALDGKGGLDYVANSYHTFGINGTTAPGASVSLTSNTALPGLANRTTVLSALTTASDHLPVVADYTFAVPEPMAALALMPALLILRRR